MQDTGTGQTTADRPASSQLIHELLADPVNLNELMDSIMAHDNARKMFTQQKVMMSRVIADNTMMQRMMCDSMNDIQLLECMIQKINRESLNCNECVESSLTMVTEKTNSMNMHIMSNKE